MEYKVALRPLLTDNAHSPALIRCCMGCIQCRELKDKYKTEIGHGQRRTVSPSASIRSGWKEFLQNDTNKQDLFAFLAKEIEKCKVV